MSGFQTFPGEKNEAVFLFSKNSEKCLQNFTKTGEWVALNFSAKKILYLGWLHDMNQMPDFFGLLVNSFD